MMPKKQKLSPIERKRNNLSNGINSSSKAQLKKIARADTNRHREQVPLGNLYVRVDKQWVDKGKICQLCSQPLAFNTEVIDKHRYVCSVLNKKEYDEDYVPEPKVSVGRMIQTPDGLFTMEQAQRYYRCSDQTIRNRVKRKVGWSYANT